MLINRTYRTWYDNYRYNTNGRNYKVEVSSGEDNSSSSSIEFYSSSSSSSYEEALIFFYHNSTALTSDILFEQWVETVPLGNQDSAIESGTYTLNINPSPSINNIIIAYPDSIRVLNSVVQGNTGMQISSAFINSTYSMSLNLNGVQYRVYQLIPSFPWTLTDSFEITL